MSGVGSGATNLTPGVGAEPPSAEERVLAGVHAAGIDLVASLPEGRLHRLVGLLASDAGLVHVAVSHEQEAVGICAGAWLGGRKPAMVLPNAGLLNCCNVLTTLNLLYQIPVLMLVSYRGCMGDPPFFHAPLGLVTEPVLQALGVRYERVTHSEAIERAIVAAQVTARASSRPVAVLLEIGAFEER